MESKIFSDIVSPPFHIYTNGSTRNLHTEKIKGHVLKERERYHILLAQLPLTYADGIQTHYQNLCIPVYD